MEHKEKTLAQVEALNQASENYQTIYTGTLERPRQISIVMLSDLIDLRNEKLKSVAINKALMKNIT